MLRTDVEALALGLLHGPVELVPVSSSGHVAAATWLLGWEDGARRKHYYVRESVGIACGIFIAALHTMGLATLTHTPSPMGFLSEILDRPRNEKPFILFPIGYPSAGATVPNLTRKPLEDILIERP